MCHSWRQFCYHSLLAILRQKIGKPGYLNGFEYRYHNGFMVPYYSTYPPLFIKVISMGMTQQHHSLHAFYWCGAYSWSSEPHRMIEIRNLYGIGHPIRMWSWIQLGGKVGEVWRIGGINNWFWDMIRRGRRHYGHDFPSLNTIKYWGNDSGLNGISITVPNLVCPMTLFTSATRVPSSYGWLIAVISLWCSETKSTPSYLIVG